MSTTYFKAFSSLTAIELAQAEADYKLFFDHVDQKNPTDINTDEKARFFNHIGMARFAAMQVCRKNATKLNHDFTKRPMKGGA